MADGPEVPPRRPSRPLALKINPWSRASAIALGLVGLGAGGVAVFVTHLEAGPVALLAVGFLLLLIGMSGRMPSRLKVGDNEAAWEIEREAVQVFVERVAEEAPAERQPELLDALGELAEGAPQAAVAGITAMAYERQIREEISRAIDELQTTMPDGQPIKFTTEVTADRQRVDAILEGPTGRLIAVEARFSGKNLSTVWIDLIHKKIVDQSRAWRGPGVMLLITRTRLTHSAEQRLKDYPEIRHVTFAGPQDREALVNALREVMAA